MLTDYYRKKLSKAVMKFGATTIDRTTLIEQHLIERHLIETIFDQNHT